MLQHQLKSSISTKGDFLVLKGEAPSNVDPSYLEECENAVFYSDKDEERGMLFTAMAKIAAVAGSTIYSKQKVTIENADSAVIIINSQTSFAGYNVHTVLLL